MFYIFCFALPNLKLHYHHLKPQKLKKIIIQLKQIALKNWLISRKIHFQKNVKLMA